MKVTLPFNSKKVYAIGSVVISQSGTAYLITSNCSKYHLVNLDTGLMTNGMVDLNELINNQLKGVKEVYDRNEQELILGGKNNG